MRLVWVFFPKLKAKEQQKMAEFPGDRPGCCCQTGYQSIHAKTSETYSIFGCFDLMGGRWDVIQWPNPRWRVQACLA